MPEMVAYCGRRFTVDRRADKICDRVNYTGSWRIPDAVMLTDLRCDGSWHDGCQAECRIFWKGAWLHKVAPDVPPMPPFSPSDVEALLERASWVIRARAEKDGKVGTRYRCQNTDIPLYSELRRGVSRASADRAVHLRMQRQAAGAEGPARHVGRRSVLGRPQHMPLVAPARDLPILARMPA